MRKGFSLLELLVGLTVAVLVTAALGGAFTTGLRTEREFGRARAEDTARLQFEDRLRTLLAAASVPGDLESYFIAPAPHASEGLGTIMQSGGAESLVFTARGLPPRSAYWSAAETDFDSLNALYGPQGGLTEIGISPTAIGDAWDATGPFLREQRPSDGDSSQGGFESSLAPQLLSLRFEFFDGIEWLSAWDSEGEELNRLPAAVRVTYLWNDDKERTFVVALPESDVTSQNPVGGGE